MPEQSIMDLILSLRATCELAVSEIRDETPLSPAEYRGLMSIQPDATYSAASLAEAMGLSVSRGSRVIEKMIGNGYLERRPAAHDRRVQHITLAAPGRELKLRIGGRMRACEAKIRRRLSPDELERVALALKKVVQIFQSL